MSLGELTHNLLRKVCDCLATERDVIEGFLEAFGFPRDILKYVPSREGLYDLLDGPRVILFGILKNHSATPVQLLRNVCASLFDDDVAVELLDDALRSYKPVPSLHLVRPLEELRDFYNERIERKPIYLQRGAILIMDSLSSAGNELESFFMDLDPTSEVTRLREYPNSAEFGSHFKSCLDSWQQNQGQ